MNRNIIEATTEAKTSNPFIVNRGESCSIRAWGLANAETYTLQWDRGDGTFENVPTAEYQLTATQPNLSIVSSGLYRLVKSATASLSGASKD